MSRLDKIIAFGLVIIILAAGAVGFLYWQQSQLDTELAAAGNGEVPISNNTASRSDERPAERLFDGQTALRAFAKAQNRALEWQADAVLVSASAILPSEQGGTNILGGSASWAFSFYSPAASAAINVTVVEDTVSLTPPRTVSQAIAPLNIGGWNIDSDTAGEIFWSNGGESLFTDDDNVTVTINLSTVNENNRIEWLWAAIGNNNGRSVTVRIDATSGEILESQTQP